MAMLFHKPRGSQGAWQEVRRSRVVRGVVVVAAEENRSKRRYSSGDVAAVPVMEFAMVAVVELAWCSLLLNRL